MGIDWKAIRERKLVQWVLGYLGACFLVLQLFDVAAEPLGWSGAALILLVTAMAVGLAVVLVLAWYHGEKGRQRVSGSEVLIIGALLALGGVALAVINGSPGFDGEPAGENTVAPSAAAHGLTLAVLPFDDLGSDPDQEYLAVGMTEILTSAVARIQGLRVISRTSVMGFREAPRPMPEIARLLNADLLIEGSVLRIGDRVRITAQLIQGATDHHLWADSYEGELADAFTLVAQVARTIAHELEVVLTPEDEVRLAAVPVPSTQAMDGVLRARYLMSSGNPDDLERAIRLLEQVLDLDPAFATAWGVLAQAHLYRGSWFGGGEAPGVVLPLAEQAARRALALDPGDVEAHMAMAIVERAGFRWTEAEAAYRRVLDREPFRLDTGIHLVNLLTAMGRYEEAESRTREMMARAPLDPGPINDLVNVVAHAEGLGRQEEIFDLLERALTIDPQNFVSRVLLLNMLAAAQQCEVPDHRGLRALGVEGALGEAGRLMTDDCHGLPICLFGVAYTHAVCERPTRAAEIVAAVEERARSDFVSPAYLAMFRLLADDHDGVIEALKRGAEERDPAMQWIANGLWFDVLWGDPEYEAIVDDVGIPRARPPLETRPWVREPLTLSGRGASVEGP